ncbi:VOC family protein [Mobilitalea sibirica]|uniref:VOC family protein n=1 Tax=Mobilitalea sibirica TaxID=1462919 RepID=A0A8J7KWK8_9FIRM|nr:VOC family protein [Mobilitalea sibirica]MBH1940587.1 VOC family protein [Mobilitalea sibirica]
MLRYVHTNIIAKDSKKVIGFYKEVFQCKSIGQTRDLKGEWLDRLTGVKNAHIIGEHLCLPGYKDGYPTLEIFSYDEMRVSIRKEINQSGFAHLAFEVDNVKEMLQRIKDAGGGQIGEVVTTKFEDGRSAEFVYATDPEGNIVELQCWSKKSEYKAAK